MSWQWFMDAEGEVIHDDFEADSFRIEELTGLTDSINSLASGMVEHEFRFDDKGESKFIRPIIR
jgi:hypothetical protein